MIKNNNSLFLVALDRGSVFSAFSPARRVQLTKRLFRIADGCESRLRSPAQFGLVGDVDSSEK